MIYVGYIHSYNVTKEDVKTCMSYSFIYFAPILAVKINQYRDKINKSKLEVIGDEFGNTE